jgi:hypothetical protein
MLWICHILHYLYVANEANEYALIAELSHEVWANSKPLCKNPIAYKTKGTVKISGNKRFNPRNNVWPTLIKSE